MCGLQISTPSNFDCCGTFELVFLVLVQRAHAHVADPLASHRRLQPLPCPVEFSTQRKVKTSGTSSTMSASSWSVSAPGPCCIAGRQ